MGEHMNGLPRLGAHVAGSLEHARTDTNAAERVRARLARGEAPAPKAPVRIRRGAVLGALALAAALLLAITAWRGASERSRTLTFVVGGAAVGAGTESGVVGAFLAAPLTSELPLAFSDGTQVQVGAGARARVAEVSHRGARVLVESGVVRANVVHRADTKWLVDAGPFEVKVTGTRFDVGWEPADQAIVVTLHEGSVVVTGCTLAEGQRVSAGQQLRASCKTGISTVGTFASTTAPDTTSVASATVASAAAVDPSATAASALPDAPPEAWSRVRPVTAPAVAPAVPSTATGMAATAVSGASGASPATAAELLARANADRYAGHFDAATETLDTVRRRFHGTDAAATAAFERGRIAFDAQHDFATAGDWFDTYLRERPAGALAREALGRAIESRHRAGDGARAEQLAARYVAAYPDGPHSALARRLAEHAGARP